MCAQVDYFEPPGQNEFVVWKGDSRFFSRLTRPCDARALRARVSTLQTLLALRAFASEPAGKKNEYFAV